MAKKVEWARMVLPNYGQDKPTQEGAQAKRQRSLELPRPSTKRSKIKQSVSFTEITKDRVLLGLIDKGNPDDRTPRNKWKAVDSLICLRMVREQPGTAKVVACDNQRSADLCKQATSKIGEVYEGENIVGCRLRIADDLSRGQL